MSWLEALEAAGRGELTVGQFAKLKTAVGRLQDTIAPDAFSEERAREILKPMLEDARLAILGEFAIATVSKLVKGEALPPFPALDEPSKKTKPRAKAPKPQPEPEPAVEPEEEDADMPRDEELEDEMSPEEEEGEVEEVVVQQPRRPQRQQRVVLQVAPPRAQQRQRVRPTVQAQPRRRTLDSVLPSPERFRVYVRSDAGVRELVEDYSLDDLGSMSMEQFLREYVDPDFGSPTGVTRYEVCKVDPVNGNDQLPYRPITINSERSNAARPADPFAQVNQAFELLETVQRRVAPQESADPLLAAAKQRAVQGGDMMQLMMLMMMEKANARPVSNESEMLKLILDRLDGKRGSNDFGAPAPMPPMMMPMPPPPPQENKLMDALLAKSLNSSPMEQLEMMLKMNQLMNGGQNNVVMMQLLESVKTLTQELATLKAGNGAAVNNGIEGALANFEKFTTVVKSVTPQLVGGAAAGAEEGGIGSALKNIITPKLGEALGNALAQGMAEKQPPVVGPVAPAPQPTQAAQPTQPAPLDPNRPPSPPPQAVREAYQILTITQTPPARVEKFLDVLQAMFLSGHPYYQRLLEPVIADLNKADTDVKFLTGPRLVGFQLAYEMVPKYATPQFVDDVLVALAKRFGVEPPKTLTATHSAWVITATGDLLPLQQTTPPPPPPPAPSPSPAPQLVATTVETIEVPIDPVPTPPVETINVGVPPQPVIQLDRPVDEAVKA